MTPRPFLRIGHRGARGHAPENTLLSLDAALKLGVDMIEIDVQLHPSGELLLMHDLWVDRTTNGRGALAQLPLATLRSLDAGQGQRIPTLREALQLIDQRTRVNIELKSWDGTAAAVAALLRDFCAEGWTPAQFLVSSFHLPELDAMREAAPEIPRGVLFCGVPLDWAAAASELEAECLNIASEFADARLIVDAHARGLPVYAYTVNDPAEAAALRAIGVDGVFSDVPEQIPA